MGFLRKKDRPYEVPDEVAGVRSEIDEHRARMRQQAGGDAAVNPELEKLKEQYDDRFTQQLGESGRTDDDDGGDPRDKDIKDLLGKGGYDPFVSKTSFASPDDSTPSAEVPGLESRARPPTGAKSGGGGKGGGQAQFQCDDCSATFKERWTTCPKCGGKVNKAGVDPEVEQLLAGADQGMGGVRSIDPSAELSSFTSDTVPEFAREESGGIKSADDLLTDLSDMDRSSNADRPAATPAEGFACITCGTEYKEKWGKCPKCGGNVERPMAPKEVDQIEERHQAINSMETLSAPQGSSSGSGSSMLDDLLGGGPSPPVQEPKTKGFTDLPDLDGAPAQATPAPQPTPPDEDFAPRSNEFRASDALPDDPTSLPGMDDLLGGMDLPDDQEELVEDDTTPDSKKKEDEPTMESVGIRQAEMSTDFSSRRPRSSVTKKIQRKNSGQRPTGQRPRDPAQARTSERPSPFSRPPPMTRYKPPASSPAMAEIPPPPEELRSDLLDLLKEPSIKERRR